MKKLSSLVISLSLVFATPAISQVPKSSSSSILHELKKLRNPTRVLYLAAHPDDENTRMISWLVNEVGANTAYLSLTRGDGGQNLIGKELSEDLGVLRTQELMQARGIDGGKQFFTRAVDFGYSKTAEETLEKWDEEKVLSDVVWVIRQFRPDVIITRFPPDSRGGHGHHTASAQLGIKAFKLAADPEAFPKQLEYVQTWQPKRIYWNASNWWNRDLETQALNNPEYVIVDVGGYNPVLGTSNNELASLSRTQHKSQGFGVSIDRGSQKEYLQYLEGDKAVAGLFDGIDDSWGRYGFKEANKSLQKIITNFQPSAPHQSIPALQELRANSAKITDKTAREDFQSRLDQIILNSLGWHAEVLAEEQFLLTDKKEKLKIELINRSPVQVTVENISLNGGETEVQETLVQNERFTKEVKLNTEGLDVSQPYWLTGSYRNIYPVEDQQLIGKPENEPALTARLTLSIAGEELITNVPVTRKYSDRVDGEIVQSTFIVPAITLNPGKRQMLFLDDTPQQLEVEIQFQEKDEKVTLEIGAEGYEVSPNQIVIKPSSAQDLSSVVNFTIKPLNGVEQSKLIFTVDGKPLKSLIRINYPHIDERIVLKDAAVELKRIQLKKKGEYIGYIPGAGDEVADAIRQMGYEVFILDENTLRTQDLSEFKAIVAGIRAYNTEDWLPGVKPQLMEYVKNGGNYIVQYNTASRDLLSQNIGPFPFEITRNRVTEEDAEPEFLLPNHPVLNKPNKLAKADFEGWVQERGLYFAGDWDPQYQTPIGWNDAGEDLQKGGLIIADFGKGAFVYTGISFFRELPAGVPGAYRLLANILSYRNTSAANEQ